MERVNTGDIQLEKAAEGVYLGDCHRGENVSMMYWRIDPGSRLPPHCHENEQIGVVLEGELVALVDGDERRLEPGDAYFFPSDLPHGAENRGEEPAVGIGVLAPPREDPDWKTVHAAEG